MVHTEAELISTDRGNGYQIDQYGVFIRSVPYMVELAKEARNNKAYSYRDFRVGGSLFAVDDDFEMSGILTAGNTKLGPDIDKDCSEMKLVRLARRAGFSRAIGIVVVSTDNKESIEGVTDRPIATLPPCEPCRETMAGSELFFNNTPVISVGINTDNVGEETITGYQVQSFKGLSDFFERDDSTEPFLHADLTTGQWDERPLTYDLLLRAKNEYKTKDTRAQLANMALTAVLIDRMETVQANRMDLAQAA